MSRCYVCQVVSDSAAAMTIDELAAATGTTTRRIRSLQTLGLLPHPVLRGRTGLYTAAHRDRLAAILQLQEQGFSLESLGVLFDALRARRSLAAVLGLPEPTASAGPGPDTGRDTGTDSAELYGFAELQPATEPRRGHVRHLLSVVPTTVWDESEAS
jgi:DNA-binding transcriptional MerR regulator